MWGVDPAQGGGQYCLAVGGALELDGEQYPLWFTVFVAPGDGPLTLRAGPRGLEALLQYPKEPS